MMALPESVSPVSSVHATTEAGTVPLRWLASMSIQMMRGERSWRLHATPACSMHSHGPSREPEQPTQFGPSSAGGVCGVQNKKDEGGGGGQWWLVSAW